MKIGRHYINELIEIENTIRKLTMRLKNMETLLKATKSNYVKHNNTPVSSDDELLSNTSSDSDSDQTLDSD